jgi:hypothetical protein
VQILLIVLEIRTCLSVDSGEGTSLIRHPFSHRFRAAILTTSVFIFAVATPLLYGQSAAKALTVEDIFGHRPLTAGAPQELTWSPNGEHLTYLDGGELIDLDPASGKPHILVSRAKLASLSSTGFGTPSI